MRIYTASFDNVTISAVQDIFEITAPSDAIVQLLRFHIGQSSDVGDAEEEILRIEVEGNSGAFTPGSGGTTPGEIPVEIGMAAAGTVVDANNITQISGGTAVTHGFYTWNIRVPFDLIWQPEERLIIAPTDAITIKLVAAPTDAVSASGTVVFAEIGN